MNAALHSVTQRSTSIQIVPFTKDYQDSALEVARETHADSLYSDMPLDEGKLLQQLQYASQLTADRYFRLAVRNEVVLGGLYGCIHRVFFCDELVAQDLGWWVRRSARGGSTSVRLLADFERWAREKGASKVGLGQTGVQNMERTLKLFQHCGYRLTGYNVIKEL